MRRNLWRVFMLKGQRKGRGRRYVGARTRGGARVNLHRFFRTKKKR